MGGPSKALAEFVSEAQETVDTLSRDLLALDRSRGVEPDPDLVNRIFRSAHSLKGTAAMFGVGRLASLAHALEDLLDAIRLGKAPASGAAIDVLLESVELLQRMVREVNQGDEGEGPRGTAEAAGALAGRIAAIRTSAGAGPSPSIVAFGLDPSVLKVLTEYEEHRLRENLKEGHHLMHVRAEFDLADFDRRLADLDARLRPLGERVATLPAANPSGPSRIGFDVIVGTANPPEVVAAAIAELGASVEPIVGPRGTAASASPQGPTEVVPPSGAPPARPARLPGPAPAPHQANQLGASGAPPGPAARDPDLAAFEPETSLRSATQTVRVDIRKLDALMNIVGELALSRVNLERIADGLRAGLEGTALAADRGVQGHLSELAREGRALERRLNLLQAGILDVRMVPLGQVFDKLARLVRKVARDAGKEIDLRVAGADVELDKLIVEELSDPLMHLVRNAIDHGIEPVETRAQSGKPRRGLIALGALQKGNHVVIEVSDDGAGIDPEEIKAVAVRRQLLDPDAAVGLSPREVLELLFVPGFSTAVEVSELSGRGVGLDVVKTNIANLSGIIDVSSQPGAGTTMSITLPVTLAILRALLVGVSGRVYAVPLNSVIEIVAVEEKALRRVSGREVLDLRGSTLPLVRLARLFRLAGPPSPLGQSKLGPSGAPPPRLQVVIVQLAQERLGIAVDELVGQQDVVIKSLGRMLPPVRGIAGATDLGQRRTVLVLDVGAIISEVLRGTGDAYPSVPLS